MFRSSAVTHELDSLVDTFITRWDISHDVASKLVRCPPDVQWQVISRRPPWYLRNPNGLVMSRISEAKTTFYGPPQLCSSTSETVGYQVLSPPASPTSHHANAPDVDEVSASPLPQTDKTSSESDHPSPFADWEVVSDPEKQADRRPASKKMLRKTGKRTIPKAMPRKMALQAKCVRNRSRSPSIRRGFLRACHVGQVPAEMQILIMVLEQRLLDPLEVDTPVREICGYRVLPLIIPFGGSPN